MKIQDFFFQELLPFEKDVSSKLEELESLFKKFRWIPFFNQKKYFDMIEELKYLFTVHKALHRFDEELMNIGRKNKIVE